MRLGALEAGGTKMVCAICDEAGNVSERVSIPTTTPAETMPKLVEYFKDKEIDCLGIACFGPIDLREDSDTYGYITTTPKAGWANVDVVGAFKELGVPIGFDVDVNGSVLGEVTFGIGKGKSHVIYITIGTGIGVGVYQEGKLLHGMQHPEGGHILLPIHPDDPMKKAICPFHPNCFEGLASGSAVKARWGMGGLELIDRDEVWDLEAYYVASALVNYTATLSPELIILGGGLMHQHEQLLPRVHKKYAELLNGYIKTEQTMHPENYIVCQSLNDNQGILGAAMLGLNALRNCQK
ncbi:MAG: ROK family protein [Lachnospiraceae bacterium]|nr:ROK family protein [Lachnospiraceae bacterium]